jgi:glycosyltransferase involved in cell wall biosynthesis
LPPIFSTSKLKFLPYVPAHTDLAPFHPALARELPDYDLLHTTDAYFAFARTAERYAQWNKIPLVTSFHTDTPAYTELFTRQTLRSLLGPNLAGWVNGRFRISVKERLKKEKRLAKHVRAVDAVMASRSEDLVHAPEKTFTMRLGVDKEIFAPDTQARAEIEREFNITPGQFIILFVGRVDAGKNLPTLLQACVKLRERGVPLHLLLAGSGPMEEDVKKTLGGHASLPGFISADRLAKFYNAADCLAIASDIEIGGLIGLEAMACGCPVLVSRQSDIAGLLGRPGGMQEVESGVENWTEALAEFAANKDKQKQMRAAALTFRAEKLASWDDVWREDFLPVWLKALGK